MSAGAVRGSGIRGALVFGGLPAWRSCLPQCSPEKTFFSGQGTRHPLETSAGHSFPASGIDGSSSALFTNAKGTLGNLVKT